MNLKDVSKTPREPKNTSTNKQDTDSKTSKSKTPPAVKHRTTLARIVGGVSNAVTDEWPPFGKTYAVMQDRLSSRIPVEVDKRKCVRFVSDAGIKADIAEYLLKECTQLDMGFENTNANQVDDIYKMWKHIAAVVPMDIPAVACKSFKGYAFHKLDFDLNVEGETPVFDEMMKRLSQPETVMAWVGSLFESRASRSQYLWIWGGGSNGKSRITKFLKEILGDRAARAQIAPAQGREHFWAADIVGSRLAIFNDFDRPRWVTTGFFKSLTGDAYIRVERKGQDAFDGLIDAMFIFTSNDKPAVSSRVADTRRALYVELEPYTGDTISESVYDALLLAEGPQWLTKCFRLYRKLCPNFEVIPYDKSKLNVLIEDSESEMVEFIDNYFERCPLDDSGEDFATFKDIAKAWFEEFRKKPNNQEIKDIKALLIERFGGLPARTRLKDERGSTNYVRVIRGVRLRKAACQALNGHSPVERRKLVIVEEESLDPPGPSVH